MGECMKKMWLSVCRKHQDRDPNCWMCDIGFYEYEYEWKITLKKLIFKIKKMFK